MRPVVSVSGDIYITELRSSPSDDPMDRNRFVFLALLAFGLILVSFVILGTSRIVLPYRTARLLAAPTTVSAFLLVCYLFVRALLSVLGLSPIEAE